MLAFFAFPASAWEVRTNEDGVPLAWRAFPAHYVTTPTDVVPFADETIAAAFSAWQDVDGTSIRFAFDGHHSGDAGTAPDMGSAVRFDADFPFRDQGALALSSVWTDEAGDIVSFDIEVDAQADWTTTNDLTAWDLQAALTHEAGHVLGLDHSTHEDATMWGTQRPGEPWRRALTDDDADAARSLYDDRLAVITIDAPPPVPRGCATAPAGAWPVLLLSPFLLRRSSREKK